ncbi:MAG: prolipoprotein diacylglyceryl transferase [Lachnospiraceae bacterium]|nr:prolipoprotein diacylglyceryl transferase [Lachnospiraceae bacterium]
MLLDGAKGVASIIFPHLGIKLGYFPSQIKIGSLSIAFYGLIIAIGMILGIWLSISYAKKTSQCTDGCIDVARAAIIFGIIGSRVYYVLFSLDYYIANPDQILNLRGGGLAIYGGIIGGYLAAFVVCKVKKISILRVLDTVAPGIVLAQALGRWGNFFNREAYGEFTDSLFAMQIKYDEASGVVTDLMKQNMVTVDGTKYIQVTPTFLYESLWCISVFILILIFRKYQKYNGEVLLWYLGGYALGRAWIEGLRTDSLYIGHTNLAVSQLLSIIVVAGALAILVINRIRLSRKTWTPNFELVLTEGKPGTLTYSKNRIAARKAKKNEKYANTHGEEKKNASKWETYTVEKTEESKEEE